MASKIALIIIPGSFCSSAAFYEPTIQRLESILPSDQVEAHVFGLQSSGPANPHPEVPSSLYDDAAFFRSKAEEFLNDGKDVVILGHSYGGMVATECLSGLPVKDTTAGNERAGVRCLIYLTALVPRKGDSTFQMLQKGKESGESFIVVNGEFMYMDYERSGPITFSDLPQEEAIGWAKRSLGCQSAVSFTNECTHEGWRDVPKLGYIVCTKDRALDPERLQKQWVSILEEERGKDVVQVKNIETDHIAVATRVDVVSQAIKELLEGMM